jgi:hypothetical protein
MVLDHLRDAASLEVTVQDDDIHRIEPKPERIFWMRLKKAARGGQSEGVAEILADDVRYADGTVNQPNEPLRNRPFLVRIDAGLNENWA